MMIVSLDSARALLSPIPQNHCKRPLGKQRIKSEDIFLERFTAFSVRKYYRSTRTSVQHTVQFKTFHLVSLTG